MSRYLPNLISIMRIFLTILMIPFAGHIQIFFTLYLLSGLSDVLDGYIARKTGTQSQFGAKLDSFADLIMFTAIIWSLIEFHGDFIIKSRPLFSGVLVIRIANLLLAWWKYRRFVILHSWGNKATGILVFLAPFLLYFFHSTLTVKLILEFAVLAAVEEGIIHLKSPYPELNRRSLFFK